jgi:hypothetical protein
MRQISLAAFLLAASLLSSAICVQAANGERCRIMDPTGTPLNARTGPHGTVLGTLSNGALVSIIDQTRDERGRPWVYVADYETRQPIGWVYREYIACF